MKIPEIITRNCHTCGKSRFKLKEIKKGPSSSLSWIERQKKRYGNRGGIGKFGECPPKKVKKSKRPHILATCTTCTKNVNITRPRCIKWQIVKK